MITSIDPPLRSQVIEGAYLADILAQPSVLLDGIAALDLLGESSALAALVSHGRFGRIVMTGMGSSLHATYPLYLQLILAGYHCVWIETSELLVGFEPVYAADTLLIVVSQSGESAEVVQLLKRSSAFGYIIGVTNHAASTVGRSSRTTLLMHAGTEATVSCKTYVATLAVLSWLAATLIGQGPQHVLAALKQCHIGVVEYLGRWREHVESLRDTVDGVDAVFVTGRGRSLATAGTGGLILKESTRRASEGMSCAAFRHGPLEMADTRTLLIVLEGDKTTAALNRLIYADVLSGGGRAAFVSSTDAASAAVWRLPAVADAVRPIVEILPIQMLSLAVAARDDVEAGCFRRASKITATE